MFRSASKVGVLASVLALWGGSVPRVVGEPVEVESPGAVLKVAVEVREGVAVYQVSRLGKSVIAPSRLGIKLVKSPTLDGGFKIAETKLASVDTTWTQVWGEEKDIRDRHNELAVTLVKADGSPGVLEVVFRVFDDGVGFRYRIPEQPAIGAVEIAEELSEFALPADHRCWWIPAFEPNRYEYHYTDSPLSKSVKVHTPVTFETGDGLYVSIHEAALTDFPSMALWRKQGTTFQAELYPWSDGVKARGKAPMVSPWRTIQIADTPGGLIDNYLVLNLNEPNKLEDVSWIKPGKYVGIWWEMHLELSTWHAGPRHGATTENTKRYIDFAARHGFDGVLVEGWNTGWESDWFEGEGDFNFTQPYPDFDLPALAKYAQEKGVRLIGHHETGAGVEIYERQMEDAFALCEKLGIRAVKTGYVGYGQNIRRTDENGQVQLEWHHGQYMVRHYRKVTETAARHHVMLDVHEPIKDTGLRRTLPNLMTSEGACGTEYDAWGGENRNPPDHTTILPFTRLLAGPMDFTPGIFKMTYPSKPNDRVSTTLAKQLALYVVIYSPLQMAADLPENYEANLRPFQFIKDVPADWAETVVLNGMIGDYITTARKDRRSEDWYIGSITDENPRDLELELSFLDKDRAYIAQVYRDGPTADWEKNPYDIVIEERPVTSATKFALHLAPGGGAALRIRPADGAKNAALRAGG